MSDLDTSKLDFSNEQGRLDAVIAIKASIAESMLRYGSLSDAEAQGTARIQVALRHAFEQGRAAGPKDRVASEPVDGSINAHLLVAKRPSPRAVTMDFGKAILALRSGLKVARSGWNGKGMWLYLVPANSYQAQTEAAKNHFGAHRLYRDGRTDPVMVPYREYIAMKTVDDDVVPWTCSQSDALATDWLVVTP